MATKSKYPFKLNGYVYSKGTRAGFLRMQRMGIPRPLFRIEDRLAKIAAGRYKELVRKLLQDIKRAMAETNATFDHAPLTQDESLDDLLDFFEDMKNKEEEEQKEISNRANMAAAENTLSHKWFDGGDEDVTIQKAEETKAKVKSVLKAEQDDYLGRLFKDAGNKMQEILISFDLDKQQVFNDNMDQLNELYIDNTMQRITWEEDYIKKCMLKRITRYANGQDTRLRLDDLIKYAYSTGSNMARMFARDQMARFNKALTLSTFNSAGVTKVKWVTSHDVRVRDTHKALDGKVFDIDNLPPELDDYNCRCGLVPVEWAD